MRLENGLFISFEGGEGAGKSTQIDLLAQFLRHENYEVVVTREPGGTTLGGALRDILLHGGQVAPKAEALLYAADRAQHVAQIIRPNIEAGCVVITDRYLDSSVAYQGVARALGIQEVRDLSLWATDNLLPQLTFFFDIDPIEGFARRRGTALDRLEREPNCFHQAVRQQFISIAQAEPQRIKVIDATNTVEKIHEAVVAQVKNYLC